MWALAIKTGDRSAALTSINDGNGGANYTLIYFNNTTSTINQATLTVSTSNVTKNYDGTDSALGTPTVTVGTLYTNVDTGVQDSLSGGTFAFTDPNVGTGNKTVTVGGVTVSDGNGGGNYLVSYVNNTTSTINPATLTVSTSNVIKTYDGSRQRPWARRRYSR